MKIICFVFLLCCINICAAQPQLNVNWKDTVSISRSTATLQVVSNPMLRRKAPMHDASFIALRDLKADFVRYVPWFPYPRLAVAELAPPTSTKTFWDFSVIDPMTIDFLENTKGHSVIMNFSTIPQWMFKTEKPVAYPDDPNQVSWGYGGGTELRDSTLKELTDYYVRLVSWYTRGGFTDELGKYHRSNYHYEFAYWEVLNEPDLEHSMSPQTYTQIYDAIVTALKPIMPETKFVGMSMAFVKVDWFEYFLNPAHHKSGIPIDVISYHCYAGTNPGQKFDAYEYTVFDKAESFVNSVSYIENIRKRLSPNTQTDINELGTFVSEEMRNRPIDPLFFNLSAGVYAYFFIELSKAGIDVIGESQLVGFPTQFPDVTMINHESNKPNPRFWVLKMIKDNLSKGAALIKTGIDGNYGDDLLAQAFSDKGKRKVLLLNKRNKNIRMKFPAEFKDATIHTIDSESGDNEPIASVFKGDDIEMKPFSVKLITLNN